MKSLTNEIERCSCEEFAVSKQMNVLKTESRIRKSVACIQKIFSVPCFLIFVAHFFVCVTSLGWVFELKPTGASGVFLSTMFIEFTNAFGGLLACYWAAGGLPVAADAFRDTFRTKIQQRMLLFRKSNALCFEKCLPEISNFEQSGCGIIYFRRSSVLTLVATLLTYTLVLTNWKSE
ncbi:hypothetical protein AVEN_67878-1 [Araneus ventricosus]|uniref:Uncharacterized protein n=1 Tax=Araneus ventricosus TaxID=182803 RepID=A0A4Y2HWZ5_ARAVE|nr:hypothetical protein AVEN_67878-1 [Araneus ventricosus]